MQNIDTVLVIWTFIFNNKLNLIWIHQCIIWVAFMFIAYLCQERLMLIFKEAKITTYQVLICTFVFTEVGSLQVSRIVTPHTQTLKRCSPLISAPRPPRLYVNESRTLDWLSARELDTCLRARLRNARESAAVCTRGRRIISSWVAVP